jgi:hypothetical protein
MAKGRAAGRIAAQFRLNLPVCVPLASDPLFYPGFTCPRLEAVVRLCAVPDPGNRWRKPLAWPGFRAAGARALCASCFAAALHDTAPIVMLAVRDRLSHVKRGEDNARERA